jgi:hypothetical protein
MQANVYYVCHIDDSVRFANRKDTIKLGSRIEDKDPLTFIGARARLVVVSGKGFFYITNRKPLPGQPLSNALLVVRDHILPDTKIAQMHTRASGALINLQAMQNHLASMSDEETPRLLLVNNIRFCLNRQTFAERNKNYFFLRYQYKGETIQQKLPYTEPQQANGPLYVEINKSIFRKNNTLPDTSAIKDVQLYFQFADSQEPFLIGGLAITMANREVLLDELKIVTQHLEINGSPDDKKEAMRELIAGYLHSNYGWTDREALSTLFPELFK